MPGSKALLKHADTIIGRLFTQILPSPDKTRAFTSIRSVLFIRPGGIGDAALLIPAVRALHAFSPGVSIDILAERRNAGVFALCPIIRSVRRYDVFSEFWKTLYSKYDVVVDTEQWHRLSAVVAWLICANMKIGFATNERRRLFTHIIPYEQVDYEVDNFMRLLTPLGSDSGGGPGKVFIDVPSSDSQVATNLLTKLQSKPFVALFPGASIGARKWGGRKFGELIDRLLRTGLAVVIVGVAGDLDETEAVEQAGVLNLCGKTTLTETAAIIACSSLLVSGDSGILHIAVGLGIPTVSLFGPGREKKWAPRGDHHIIINKHLPCSPCTTFGHTPKCPINARCMAEITAEEVEEAVLTLLARKNFTVHQQKP